MDQPLAVADREAARYSSNPSGHGLASTPSSQARETERLSIDPYRPNNAFTSSRSFTENVVKQQRILQRVEQAKYQLHSGRKGEASSQLVTIPSQEEKTFTVIARDDDELPQARKDFAARLTNVVSGSSRVATLQQKAA